MDMKNKLKTWAVIAAAGLVLEGWALYVVGASPARWRKALIVQDEPEAHALYEAMIEAVRKVKSLSYTSACSGPDGRVSNYLVWIKQPKTFHVALTNVPSARSTTLVGDGTDLWIYWSGDRPYLRTDNVESYEETRSDVYLQEAGSVGAISIKDKIASLGVAWFEIIFDPSILHARADSFDPYIDGIRSRGSNKAGGELCDVIEVSYMRAQRTRFFWLSQEDHLPRRIKEVVRLAEPRVTVEEWSDVTVNPEIAPQKFTWAPPKDWRPFSPLKPESYLLTPGQEAPDFELRSAGKGTLSLSDYRGSVVWLCVWQVGVPSCREELRYLQALHEKYQDQEFTVLGLNVTDDRRIALAFLQAHKVTFPTVLDSSEVAEMIVSKGYGNKTLDTPLSYIIDRNGKVVDAWYDYGASQQRGLDALKRAGRPIEGRPGM